MTDEVRNVCMVGAGTMGRAIGAQAVTHGCDVRVFDINPLALDQAKKFISDAMKMSQKKGAQGTAAYHNSLSEALKNVDLVIEAVPEDLQLKKRVFAEIDGGAPPHAIIATNSSSIPISRIEDAVRRKEKVLNLHFYLPIQQRNMVDVMRGTKTSDETLQKGKKWVVGIGCVPIVAKRECLGFVFNRVWHAIKKDCLKILDGDYADIEDVDKAWRIFTGMPYGPFTMMDVVGLDVVLDIEMAYYKESGDPKDKPPQRLADMVKRGELGIKTGKGFYTYRKTK
nr:3-hydroxyacyl-CoA dehydrogenase family protein [Candidatus Njordarchaeum guaymaensis]